MTGRWGRGRTDRQSTAQHGRPGGRPARDGGASQIVVIGIIGAAALLLMGFLTIPMIVGGSSLLFSAGTGGFGCSGSAQQAKSALQSKVSGQAKNSIPSNYLSWYQKVGQQYGVPWVILAGIGTVESDNGRTSLPGVHSGSNAFGAAGPMQIGIGGAAGNSWGGAPVHPASETVDGVATDEDGDGTASVYDPADAIAGTAKYLLAHGVLANASAAIFAYNHLDSYVQAVQNYASSYASGGFSVAPSVGSPAASTAACVQLAGTVISGSTHGAEPGRVHRDRLRPEADRQAVPLGRHRPRRLRLLGAGHDGLPGRGRGHPPDLGGPVGLGAESPGQPGRAG